MHLLLHLRAERLLVVRRPIPLLLEEVNGERLFGPRSRSCAEEEVAGLNQLARCLVVPRRVLLEQSAELSQRTSQLLAGVDPPFACVDGTGLFLVEYGITHIDALVVVQKEDVADMASACWAESVPARAPDGGALSASEERVADSLVRLGLLRGLDGTTLQLVHGDGDVGLRGHKAPHNGELLRDCLSSLKDLDKLRGGSILDGLHGWLGWRLGVGFSLGTRVFQFLFSEWTTNDTHITRTNKNKGLLVFYCLMWRFLLCELNGQLRFHKGRHEIPSVRRAAKHIHLVGCREPLFVRGYQVTCAVRHVMTKGF